MSSHLLFLTECSGQLSLSVFYKQTPCLLLQLWSLPNLELVLPWEPVCFSMNSFILLQNKELFCNVALGANGSDL